MNIPCSLRITTTLGLAFCCAALAQGPPAAPPTPRSDAPPEVSMPRLATSQSSRVRAFNTGPDGQVRSLYLQNGSVVDVTPALDRQVGAAVRKGERITVTGTKSKINEQWILHATSIRLNGQTFSANAPPSIPPGPGAFAEGAVPPPPGTAPPFAPSPRRTGKAAAPAPCGVSAAAPPPPPDLGPPPAPPDGITPPQPPPDRMVPPPPPQY
jgi:hypothetical protein